LQRVECCFHFYQIAPGTPQQHADRTGHREIVTSRDCTGLSLVEQEDIGILADGERDGCRFPAIEFVSKLHVEFRWFDVDDVDPAPLPERSYRVEPGFASRQFVPDRAGNRYGVPAPVDQSEFVDECEVEERRSVGDDVSDAGKVEVLLEFLLRVVSLDAAVSQEPVELASRTPREFARFAHREVALPVQRDGEFATEGILALVLGHVQGLEDLARDLDRSHGFR
jgi:hypothetical protein